MSRSHQRYQSNRTPHQTQIDPPPSPGLGSDRRFADTPLSDGLKSVIPFEKMSEIQAATLDVS